MIGTMILPPKTILGYKKNGQPIFNIAGGSEPVGEPGYNGGDPSGVPQGGGNGNPAWNEFLEPIPQEYHDKVRPVLEKWDKGVQERFGKVHSQYEPWKPIIDAGVDPETASFSINLLNAINDNPRQVYEAIGNYYQLTGQNGSPSGQGPEPEELEEDPYDGRFAALERQNQIMAQHLIKQREEKLEAQASAELDRELTELRGKNKSRGDFNEKFVLAHMQNGMSAEDAVEAYYQFRDTELKKYRQMPLIMGSGGGVPQFGNTDVRKLTDGQTKDLVAGMLAQAKAQRNQ